MYRIYQSVFIGIILTLVTACLGQTTAVTHEPYVPPPVITPIASNTPTPPFGLPHPIARTTATTTAFPDAFLTPTTPDFESEEYQLIPWSADHADNLTKLMENYPELIREHFYSNIVKSIYRNSLADTAVAYQEAALRYPDDERTDKWRLAAIINKTISSTTNENLFEAYIVNALNSDELSLSESDLNNWLQKYEADYIFEVQVNKLRPLPGYISSHIVNIFTNYSGGTSFWILETPSGYESYSLHHNLDNVYASTYQPYLADLTGDNSIDFALYAGFHNGSFIGGDIAVYDLSRVPPARLSFGPEPPWQLSLSHSLSITTNHQNRATLHVYSVDSTYRCISLVNTFKWNGQWFEQTEIEPEIPNPNIRPICIRLLEDRASWYQLSNIERETLLQILENELGESPPTGQDWDTGEDFAADAQDEFRFILAMNHAILGHENETINYLSRIINTPVITQSQWIEPAQVFLDNYHNITGTYQACLLVADKCDIRHAFQRTISTMPLGNGGNYVTMLSELGANIIANGWLDLDHDNIDEEWFIIQHNPNEKAELWLITQSDQQVKGVFVDTVINTNPTVRTHIFFQRESLFSPYNNYIPFSIGTDDIYAFVRRQSDQEPYITKLRSFDPSIQHKTNLNRHYNQGINSLFDGLEPRKVVTLLTAVASHPDFKPTSQYYYHLGLAYELTGDNKNAVDAYVQAWQDCCDEWSIIDDTIIIANPYAIMARAKLELVPPVTKLFP